MSRRGFTIIELMIAITLLAFIAVGYWTMALALERRMRSDTDEAHLRLQMYNALDNMRLHCVSAARVDPHYLFPPGVTSDRSDMYVFGEQNVYSVTPSVLTDNAWYLYTKSAGGDLVMRQYTAAGAFQTEEVLVEKKYAPTFKFTYREGFEPNFMEVTVSGNVDRNGKTVQLFQRVGVRFWFVGVLAS